jgi:hypothetical protein
MIAFGIERCALRAMNVSTAHKFALFLSGRVCAFGVFALWYAFRPGLKPLKELPNLKHTKLLLIAIGTVMIVGTLVWRWAAMTT